MAVEENVPSIFGGWWGRESGVDDGISRARGGRRGQQFRGGAKAAEEGFEVGRAPPRFRGVGGGGGIGDEFGE